MSFAARTFTGIDASTSLGAYLKAGSYAAFSASPAYAVCSWTAKTNGDVAVSAIFPDAYTWLIGSGVSSDYQIRFTKTAGINPSGSSVGVWLLISTNIQWLVTSNAGQVFSTGTIEIREAAVPNTVLASKQVTISAEGSL